MSIGRNSVSKGKRCKCGPPSNYWESMNERSHHWPMSSCNKTVKCWGRSTESMSDWQFPFVRCSSTTWTTMSLYYLLKHCSVSRALHTGNIDNTRRHSIVTSLQVQLKTMSGFQKDSCNIINQHNFLFVITITLTGRIWTEFNSGVTLNTDTMVSFPTKSVNPLRGRRDG